MTGFTAPPSTTDSTTHPSKCVPGQDFYHPQMEYTRACVVIRFQIKRDQDYSSPSSILFYYSAERVINAINLGDANLTSALQNCCCQTQQNIIKMGYENQLGQKDIVNQMQTGFSQTNSGLERAASNLGFQMSQIACDLKTNANANTQRIVDVLNNHWQSDLQQRYNDARLELSQQKQNATLIAALKTTAAA